jgi:hypothetical protein
MVIARIGSIKGGTRIQCRGTTSVAAKGPRGFGVAVGEDRGCSPPHLGLTTVFLFAPVKARFRIG